VQNEDFAQMFRQRLEGRYSWHQLERTGGRGDGLVTLLKHAIVVKVPLPPPPPTFPHRPRQPHPARHRPGARLTAGPPQDRRDITFKDLGDRVALLMRVRVPAPPAPEPAAPSPPGTVTLTGSGARDLVLVNTHLLFPHQPYARAHVLRVADAADAAAARSSTRRRCCALC